MENLHSLSYRDLLLSIRDNVQEIRESIDHFRQLLEIVACEIANARAHSTPTPLVKQCRSLACAIKPKKAALLKFDSRIGKCFALSVDNIHASRILISFKLTTILPREYAIYPQLQSKAFRGQALIIDPIFSHLTLIAAYT
jgi:hypothetical protein